MKWQDEVRRDYAMGVYADENQRVNGMPLKAIKGMLKNPNTPEQIKNAWKAKLKLKGIVV
jgi:4-alpha-glucanotransferase